MAGLPCKLIAQVAFKAGGDVFHRLISRTPYHLSNVTPAKIQACNLQQGDYGTNGSDVPLSNGSILSGIKNFDAVRFITDTFSLRDIQSYGIYGSNNIIDGKEQTAKQLLQDIDEVKKTISFKMLGGDLLETYKNMLITIHVETKGAVDFITLTLDYELLKPDNPHPLSLLGFFIEFTNEVETHIFG